MHIGHLLCHLDDVLHKGKGKLRLSGVAHGGAAATVATTCTHATGGRHTKHRYQWAHLVMPYDTLSFVDVRFIAYNKNPDNNNLVTTAAIL